MAGDFGAFGGLVPFSTSGHAPLETFEIDTRIGRWKRLRHAIRESASLHEGELSKKKSRFYIVMDTLTYAPDQEPHPRDISEYLKRRRRWCQRQGIDCRYVWVGELQERGALHYHVLFWLPKNVQMPRADKHGFWNHGSTRIEAAKSSVGYLTKYASKLKSKLGTHAFPKGYRMHGCGGLEEEGRELRAYSLLPEWAQEVGTHSDKLRRAPGGGICSRITGEIWPSPWLVLLVRFVPGVGPIVVIEKVN